MMFYKETNLKETPIGKIPKEWNVTNLKSIAKISSGNTAPQDEKYFRNGKYPFIRVQHLTELQEQKYPVNCDYINDYAVSDLKLKKFKKGSIIFPKSGESIKLEKRAILKEDSYVVNHLAVIEPFDKNTDDLFLFYYLCIVKTSNYLTKTTMPSLNLSTIGDFLIPLPPLSEQQKIAEILSTVDEAIQKTNEIIVKTERLKKGLMQELLTKGIGHKEFKDTEIGRIPREWEVVKLGDVLELCQYGLSIPLKEKGKYPIVRMDEIVNGYITPNVAKYVDLDEETFEKFKLEKGDILFNRTNAPDLVGRTGIFLLEGDYVFASYLIRLRVKHEIFDPHFLTFYLIFSEERLKQLATRAVHQANINATNLKKLKIPWLAIEEQRKIVEILSTVDKKLEVERNEKAKLERIKQGLMDLFLTGKVRVKVN